MGAKSGIVFTGAKGGAIAQDTARLKLQMILKRKTTVHGIRSTFRDWADSAGIRREVAESCLSHQVAGKVESAYLRKDFFEERKAALFRWKETLVCTDDCK
jgi:integrase